MENLDLIIGIVAVLVGGGIAYLFLGSERVLTEGKIQEETHNLLQTSKEEAKKIEHEAKGDLEEIKRLAREENQRMEKHLERLEEAAKLKEKQVNDYLSRNGQVKAGLKEEVQIVKDMRQEIKDSSKAMIETLLKGLGITKEEAIEQIKKNLYHEITGRKDQFIKMVEEDTAENAMKDAKNILVGAIQRYSDKSSVDHNHSLVEVKQERFKAMLVGPNCENINHLESRYDVEIIFNDLPKTITIGGFNLVNRHIVKEAIHLLQKRKAITPKVIDQCLDEAEKKVAKVMVDKAKEAVTKAGLKTVPKEILKYIGRLHFRTSYGQNALKHSLEVGMFAGLLASEVGANVKLARVAGFLHDIGKAISEESDKGHDVLTKEILEAHNFPHEIVHAAWAHHEGEPLQSLEAKVIMAADALSASRPGARLESLERYLARIRALEETAASFPGIKKTFAISAGREVRVIVKPKEVKDEAMNELAHNIVNKIEENLNYPGNIKVNVIRRMKWDAMVQGEEPKTK